VARSCVVLEGVSWPGRPLGMSGGIAITCRAEQQDGEVRPVLRGQRRPGGDVALDAGFEPGGFQRGAGGGDRLVVAGMVPDRVG